MTEEDNNNLAKEAIRSVQLSVILVVTLVLVTAYYALNPDLFSNEIVLVANTEMPTEEDLDRIENGIHLRTGFIDGDGMYVVIANCTNCHSSKLVTQNRMTAERWNETITWMQETQGLWDLGENQEVIVNYLVTNYPPATSGGRRANLSNIDWYELED